MKSGESTTLTPLGERVFWRWVLFLLLLVQGLMMWRWVGAYAGGGDSSGYLNSARLLSEGRLFEPMRGFPELRGQEFGSYAMVPLGLNPTHGDQLVPTYPTGLPLFLALAGKVFGWDRGPDVLMVLFTIAATAAMYALGRQAGLSRLLALLGALALGTCPLEVFSGGYLMSDVPATLWGMLVILATVRARSGRGWAWDCVAGLAFGLGVLTRPTNLLLLPAAGLLLGLGWRRWLRFLLGGLPAGLFFLVYNQLAYGFALSTGYGNDLGLFESAALWPTFLHYLLWLPVLLSPCLLLALVPARRVDEDPSWSWVILAWVLPLLAFYLSYHHTRESWWYMRFVLPAFPAFILGMMLGLRRVQDAAPGGGRHWVPVVVFVLVLLPWNLVSCRLLKATTIGNGEGVYLSSTRMAVPLIPRNAVVLCMQSSGALFFYTDLSILRYEQFPRKAAALASASFAASGRPMYAVLHDFEIPLVLEGGWGEHWTRIATLRHVSVWRLDRGAGNH
jgi:hypothetical protein